MIHKQSIDQEADGDREAQIEKLPLVIPFHFQCDAVHDETSLVSVSLLV
jgi:hypothetical protein